VDFPGQPAAAQTNRLTTRENPVLLYDPAKLRAWRDESGLTRERVSADISDDPTNDVRIGYAWLQKLEAGTVTVTPPVAVLRVLAHYYGHQTAELLTADEAVS
jgi:hypothetical protein